MIARGATLAEAGCAVGRCKGSVSRIAKKAGITPAGKLPLKKAKRIGRLLARDEPIRQIARKVDVSTATVHRQKQRRDGDGPRRVAKYFCHGCSSTVYFRPCQVCTAVAVAARAQPSKRLPPGV
jgi:transposase-like protein